MKKRTKILCCVMCIAVAVGFMPAFAFADTPASAKERTEIKTAKSESQAAAEKELGATLSYSDGVTGGGKIKFNTSTGMITGATGTITAIEVQSSYGDVTCKGIYQFAFENLDELVSLTFHDEFGKTEGTYTIGSAALWGCDELTEVVIPAAINSIGIAPFADCVSLTEIKVAEENPKFAAVDGVLFDNTKTELIQFPCGFEGSYVVPDGVTTICEEAFSESFITEVTIPASVTSIESMAFGWGWYLEKIIVNKDNPNYKSSYGVLYNKSGTRLIQYPVCKLDSTGEKVATSYYIPNTVTRIGDYAFAGSWLKTLTLGSGISALAEDSLTCIWYLKEMKVSVNNKYFRASGGVLYNKSKTALYMYPYYKTGNFFEIPSSVKTIKNGAIIANKYLNTLVIRNNVTTVGDFSIASNLSKFRLVCYPGSEASAYAPGADLIRSYIPSKGNIISLTAGKKKITVKWSKKSYATGYRIYRATTKGGTYKLVKTITKGSTVKWTNSKLKGGKRYYYKVRAYKKVNGYIIYGSYSGYKSKVTKK